MALDFAENPAASAGLDSVRNLEETAEFFGVSVPTVRSWIREKCPVVDRGSNGVAYKLDLREVAAWREERAEADRRADAARRAADEQLAMELLGDDMIRPDGAGAMSPRQIRELADAQKSLLLVEQQRGALVKAEELAILLSGLFRRLADRLRLLPDELERAHGLDADQAATIADRIDDALNDLADEIEREAELKLEAAAAPPLAEAAE